ncbi:zinc-ribbon domain-containing protein [Falsiroseomonas sp.]|uniref:zinc-ribbon domain-containing protein n=1 Tax=Falsiroseomonas sp. TaxID=2870721 RepID=UPI00356581D0
MRIACPNCSAEYEVPDSLLATGPRLLRCARCGHQFQAALPGAPPAPEAAPPPPAAPPPAAAPEEAAPPPPPEPPPPPPEPPPPAEPPRRAPPAVDQPMGPERDRPPPTRGPTRHSPIDPPSPEPSPEEPERSTAAVALAWLLSLALVAAAGWATWRYHAEITAFWPPAARLYQALGVQ